MKRSHLLAPVAVLVAAVLASNAWTTPVQGVQDFAPVCEAGPLQWLEANGPISTCPLDGTASYDPDGGPLTYLWEHTSPRTWFDDPTSPTPMLSLDMEDDCLHECGAIQLTVTDDEGNSASCTTAVIFRDTTPPMLACPDDLLMLWAGGYPTQTDPALTGMAIAVDIRDPAPLVTYSDVVVNGVPPTGIEQVITRTWVAEDLCGHVVQDVQVITLVGESFFGRVALDIMPNQFPNPLWVDQSYQFRAIALGSAEFDARFVDPSSICLQRVDGLGGPCLPLTIVLADVGSPQPGKPWCSLVPDGFADIVVLYDVPDLVGDLGLGALRHGSPIRVQLTGLDLNGFQFVARDGFIVLRNGMTFDRIPPEYQIQHGQGLLDG